MGCLSSKPAAAPAAALSSEAVELGSLSNDETDKWRVEPQRALNHFLKGTSGDRMFDMDSSLFDYFQDDEFVELRTLLDEPLGRSHFLAHVEHYFPDNTSLVRLWLLLHKFHHMQTDDEGRFQAAKSIYKNYFQIGRAAKEEAERYRVKNLPAAQGAGEPGAIEGDPRKWDAASVASASSTASEPTMLRYHEMLVPEASRAFPARVVAVIILLRPKVEEALFSFLHVEALT